MALRGDHGRKLVRRPALTDVSPLFTLGMNNMNWFTGSGTAIEFDQIIDRIRRHSFAGGTVHLGTDSHLKQQKCVFSTAICLIGSSHFARNTYFVTRSTAPSRLYQTLFQRITEEVQQSVDMGLKLLEVCPTIDIELHLDISPEEVNEGTSKFANMLVGYARGSGFECKIKPDAFAASSVADKHSKPETKGK